MSGVRQGSNLRPQLIATFIDRFPACVKYSSLLIFADDFRIFKKIVHPEDCKQLQTNFYNVVQTFYKLQLCYQ